MSATIFQCVISMKLPSLANQRMNWQKRHRITKGQRELVFAAMVGRDIPDPPVVVTLTRCGPRTLDDDNLRGAFKAIRDQIAEELGIDDGDASAAEWRYEQETRPASAACVVIRIEAKER